MKQSAHNKPWWQQISGQDFAVKIGTLPKDELDALVNEIGAAIITCTGAIDMGIPDPVRLQRTRSALAHMTSKRKLVRAALSLRHGATRAQQASRRRQAVVKLEELRHFSSYSTTTEDALREVIDVLIDYLKDDALESLGLPAPTDNA